MKPNTALSALCHMYQFSVTRVTPHRSIDRFTELTSFSLRKQPWSGLRAHRSSWTFSSAAVQI